MKAFVTGGTGFIGQHVVRKLVARGYSVVALARSESGAERMRELGAMPAMGDITDSASMRAPMKGSDIVFHVAGWYETGRHDWMQAEIINVGGTRKVLRLAHEMGVPRIVYVSSAVVFGDTGGKMVDETYQYNGPFSTEYDRTKWLAHYKVAIPLMEKGAPIIIAMPGVAYGPGDHSAIMDLMRSFYRGAPVLAGPEMTVTYAHVEDIAEGIILAAEKGRIGESYILAGPAVPLGEMYDFWSYLTGKRAPVVRVPARVLQPLAPAMNVVGSALSLPPVISAEGVNVLGLTYMVRADKARRELGWEPRPLQTGMLETFEWIAETTPERPQLNERQKKVALLALLGTLLVLFVWLRSRRRSA